MSVKQRNVTIERGIKISGGGSNKDAGAGGGPVQQFELIKRDHEKHEKEKAELQVLNERFSSYVERVRALEAMNRKLLADIDDMKSKWGFDSSKIKDQMEPELLKFREHIDEITRLKAIAEIKAKRAETDAVQFRHLMELAMDSFNADKNKIQNLERLLENTKQDGDYLRSQMHDINEQIAKYVEEQRRLMEQLKQLKDDLDRETIDRVARQNEVQTLEEQISFLKAVHEQEVAELGRLQTIVGFDPAQFYRTELERAIRDIRGDFEQLNQEQKRELEEWYRIKTEEVEKEVAKEREMQRMQQTGLSAEEANQLKQTCTDSKREFLDLQRRHGDLSARLRELEEHLEQSKTTNQVTLIDRDREIAILREKISDLVATYDELMGRKTSLEFEINTYRRLLECEETRISSKMQHAGGDRGGERREPNYTTYSTTTRTVTSTSNAQHQQSSSGGVGGGGGGASGGGNVITSVVREGGGGGPNIESARQVFVQQVQQQQQPQPRPPHVETSSETVMKRMQVQRTSKGPVGIKEISPDGKYVVIENTGKRGDQDISKWQVKRKVDNEPDIVFSFPLNTIIGSGRTIRIWSRAQGRQNPPHEFVHDMDWRFGESMVTRLLSDSGEERALYSQRAS